MSLIENELSDLEDVYLDISRIAKLSNSFYNLCIEKNNQERSILNLFQARTHFESCLTILKSLIEPNKNDYIQIINAQFSVHDALEKYFENFLAILDTEQKNLQSNVNQSKILTPQFMVQISIKLFREKLVDYMENIIITPFYNSVVLYKNLKEKNKESFEYVLFREVFISSKIKGSAMRQKITVATQSFGAQFHETNITKYGKRQPREGEIEIQDVDIPPDIDETLRLLDDEERGDENV